MTAPVTWTLSAERALERLDGRLFATVTEASAVLSYDRMGRTIRKAIEAGEIPAVKAGSTYRIPVSWIRQQLSLDGSTGA